MTQLLKLGAMTLYAVAFIFIVMRWQINGWGSVAWFVGGFAINMIRAPYASKTKDNIITEQRRQKLEKFLLIAVAIGGSFLPTAYLLFGILSFSDYIAPFWVPYAGVVLMVIGLFFFWRSHADLGQNWSVTTELHDDQSLVTQGVYKYMRHPMYSAIFLMFMAQPFLVHNWIAGFGALLAFTAMYLFRIDYEEKMMLDRFGDDYRAYCAKSGRILPKFG